MYKYHDTKKESERILAKVYLGSQELIVGPV